MLISWGKLGKTQNHFALERVTGVEPVFPPWQGGIIAAIRYPQDIVSLITTLISVTLNTWSLYNNYPIRFNWFSITIKLKAPKKAKVIHMIIFLHMAGCVALGNKVVFNFTSRPEKTNMQKAFKTAPKTIKNLGCPKPTKRTRIPKIRSVQMAP